MYMGNAQNRHASRKRVLIKAVIIGAEGLCNATIRDLSPSGAQLFSEQPPKKGRDVIFKRGDIFAAARVAWTDGKTYGIEFYRMLKPEKLSRPESEDR